MAWDHVGLFSQLVNKFQGTYVQSAKSSKSTDAKEI